MEAASMYNYIRSKHEILELLCFSVANTYVSQLSEIEQQPTTYVTKVRALLSLHIRLMLEQGPEVSVANHDWKYLPEPQRGEFVAVRKDYEGRFANLIKEGMERGELQAGNPTVALFTLLSAVRWVELWYRPGRQLSAQTLEADIINFLMKGLEGEERVKNQESGIKT
jgi:AcrR family transcriptional regulator